MNPDRREHILVVEDDDLVRPLIVRMLENAGFRVTGVDGFSAAIKVIDSSEPLDLLLTDVGMPTGTPHGIAIANMAKNRRFGLKVIYMSGNYQPEQIAQYINGAEILSKPISATTLVEAVKTALASRASPATWSRPDANPGAC